MGRKREEDFESHALTPSVQVRELPRVMSSGPCKPAAGQAVLVCTVAQGDKSFPAEQTEAKSGLCRAPRSRGCGGSDGP